MPKGYICSNCGAPVSPAQNRCHQCGAEIDWEKAVGRVSYINYLPDERKRRRRRRRVLLTGVFFTLAVIIVAIWGWNEAWTQSYWRAWLGTEAYRSYEQGVRNLRQGQFDEARGDFERMISLREKQTPAFSPTPAPALTPTPLLVIQPTEAPAATSPPTATSTPDFTPSPAPDENQALELVLAAQKLSEKDPCRAAELLQSALALQDLGWIEAMRQENQARCQQSNVTPPQIASPLPTPAPSAQRIAYTAYDAASGAYAIQTWSLGDHLPGPSLMNNAMQPAFGPDGSLAYRSTDSEQPGVFLLYPDGGVRRITKGPDDSWPRWGPGGEQIIFTSAQRSPDGSPHIYLADINTRSVEDLGPGRHADWSRTGQIIFSGCDVGGEQCGLWRLDPTTLQRSPVTDIPDDSAPIWSPDGRYVVFMSSGRSESWDVFILDTETDFIIPTATHPAEDGLPVWSPDGRTIAFLSNRDGDWAVFAWRLDDLTTNRLFPVAPELPNWQQAGIDWGIGIFPKTE